MSPRTDQTTTNDALLSPSWLAEHLDDRDVRVVEVDVSSANYDEGHVQGATLWNIYRDLKTPRYETVDEAALESLVRRSGIHEDSLVAFYGYAPAMGYWLLRYLGHENVGIVDANRETLKDEGMPWSQHAARPSPTSYRPAGRDPRLRATAGDVEASIADPARTLVDVRTREEYEGERFWPSGGFEPGGEAGHIPSARHHPIDAVHDDRGAFRSTAALRECYGDLLSEPHPELVTYCTIGARACTSWFVLTELLGRERVRVYDGSWAEWGLRPSSPVIR